MDLEKFSEHFIINRQIIVFEKKIVVKSGAKCKVTWKKSLLEYSQMDYHMGFLRVCKHFNTYNRQKHDCLSQ